MDKYTLFIFATVFLGLIYMVYNYVKIRLMPEGTAEMVEISAIIRSGANTFLLEEWKVLIIFIVIVSIIFGAFFQVSSAISFVIGATMSGLAGLVGMKSATYSNVRVANKAYQVKGPTGIGETLIVALRGGCVMGLAVVVFALLGLNIVKVLFSYQRDIANYVNWIHLEINPYTHTLTSYSLGCSMVAIFNRVGGGIYTKAADMGADTVGKNELGIPEDDPRNPAVISDCVGDNVGDVAGLGSDLLESFMGSITSAIVLTISLNSRYVNLCSAQMFDKLLYYPILFCAFGLLSCILGLIYIFLKKPSSDPQKELNAATWMSAGITALTNLIMTIIFFRGEDIGNLPFKFGVISPFVAAVFGMISGIIIGELSEYYTSSDYTPTKIIAAISKEGPSLNIVSGIAYSMMSAVPIMFTLGLALYLSDFVAGVLGISIAAVGILSYAPITVSVDTYGPISDNAGGIAEMVKLPSSVREITDKLDSVGNTTAAVGKGFAIGSATFATVSMMLSYLYTYTPANEAVTLNIIDIPTLVGFVVGTPLPYFFTGLIINSVSKTAGKMVDEVRRQFSTIEGLREGKVKPDYNKCIQVATKGALSEMKFPAIISIMSPIIAGFIFGPQFLAGLLLGSILSSIALAIFAGNSGGAWDNAKKSVEAQGLKGTNQHYATVVGDTVGDPLKDAAGPSLDIFIKIMNTISVILVPVFVKYNLVSFLANYFK